MITVAEAKALVLKETAVGPCRTIPLGDARGLVLARVPRAAVDLPTFDNSAMDGFAVAHEATSGATPEGIVRLPVVGDQRAGDGTPPPLSRNLSMRIATGAMLPKGATAVIAQEEVVERDGTIAITRPVPEGQHVRRRGEELARGDEILPTGTLLTPAAIGCLSAAGIDEVDAVVPPSVAIVPTGSELREVGRPLAAGEQYESNSVALRAAVEECGIIPRVWPAVPDDPVALTEALRSAMAENDYVIVSGGLSVGKADYVKPILAELGVDTIFWGVRQKPGKPLFFGQRGTQIVFGLPGNPVSALVCFYEYVRLSLKRWIGCRQPDLPAIEARLAEPVTTTPGRAHFLRAIAWPEGAGWMARPVGPQESHRMRPFGLANSLLALPDNGSAFVDGTPVEVHLLPPFDHRPPSGGWL